MNMTTMSLQLNYVIFINDSLKFFINSRVERLLYRLYKMSQNTIIVQSNKVSPCPLYHRINSMEMYYCLLLLQKAPPEQKKVKTAEALDSLRLRAVEEGICGVPTLIGTQVFPDTSQGSIMEFGVVTRIVNHAPVVPEATTKNEEQEQEVTKNEEEQQPASSPKRENDDDDDDDDAPKKVVIKKRRRT